MSALREDAARVLDDWAAPSTGQDALRQEYAAHLAAHPDGMWKSCASGHLTASALVVDAEGGRVLLTLHRKIGRWLQTGGHCEREDDSLAGAALREATEESGIDGLRLLPAPVRLDRHDTPCATHLDVQYAALAPVGATPVISEESTDLRWFGFAEAERLPDHSVRRLVAGARGLL
ncbi:NUDIX hydrolase [Streptomyces sedi]|uniref:NUDIX hydrolase n=1 Tax=Streptomyces sedi TaxID=555059 RepID=A0A5C4VAK6_9ACTN|nr:NUDIX hydrolase [Streptomyces sedi]TNM32861.1 NUDIX hydrolase [Streptomyces sedi]